MAILAQGKTWDRYPSLCWLEATLAQPIRSHFGSSRVRPSLAQPICNEFGSRPFFWPSVTTLAQREIWDIHLWPFWLSAMLAQPIRSRLGSRTCWLNISVAILAQHIRSHFERKNLGIYICGHFVSKPSWLNISIAMLAQAVLGHVGSTYP